MIECHMPQREIDGHFNPPFASHMGRACEGLMMATLFLMNAIPQQQLLHCGSEENPDDRPKTLVSYDPRYIHQH